MNNNEDEFVYVRFPKEEWDAYCKFYDEDDTIASQKADVFIRTENDDHLDPAWKDLAILCGATMLGTIVTLEELKELFSR
jgi:hypothetical protein